jgi:hypothetical protein
MKQQPAIHEPTQSALLTLVDVPSRLQALRVFNDDMDAALEQLLRRNLAAFQSRGIVG